MTTKRRSSRFQLPEFVIILGCKFSVSDVVLSDNTYGETDGTERTIKVDLHKHTSQEQVTSTLFHEMIHAVLHVSGQSELLRGKQEEALVVALEHGLMPNITLTAP
jgi:hypothetical protein